MSDRSSRHRSLGTYRRALRGTDAEVELYEPRFVETPPAVAHHAVQASERIDTIAHTYFHDPHQYWRIADANMADHPEDLLDPGRVLAIPEGD